jgi:hypothetical protein
MTLRSDVERQRVGTAIVPPASTRENVHLDVLEIVAERRISSGTKEQMAFSTGRVEFHQ